MKVKSTPPSPHSFLSVSGSAELRDGGRWRGHYPKPLSQGNRSQFPQAPGHNEPCESHWLEPLVIRDNAWPSVLKDIPGSPEAGRVLPSALAFCLPGFARRGWGPPGDSFLPAAGSRGSGHTFPVATPSLPGPHPAGRAAPFFAYHHPKPFRDMGLEASAPKEVTEQGGGSGDDAVSISEHLTQLSHLVGVDFETLLFICVIASMCMLSTFTHSGCA